MLGDNEVLSIRHLRKALNVMCHLIKTSVATIAVLNLLVSCDFRQNTFADRLNDIKKDFSQEAVDYNNKTLAWNTLIDSLYKVASDNPLVGLKTVDNLLKNASLDRHEIAELHFVKGDIYYKMNNAQLAVEEYTTSGQEYKMGSPKDLAARAGAYIKLQEYKKAFADLSKASETNYDYLWNVGNYYEVIGEKDSAIANYKRLYLHDTVTYRNCQERIEELNDKNSKPLTGLIYRDRERKVLLLQGVK